MKADEAAAVLAALNSVRAWQEDSTVTYIRAELSQGGPPTTRSAPRARTARVDPA
jgi:hypothetical protein